MQSRAMDFEFSDLICWFTCATFHDGSLKEDGLQSMLLTTCREDVGS